MNIGELVMQSAQFHTPPLTKTNKIIIISIASFFLLQTVLALALKFNIASYLGLSYNGFLGGLIFQALSYPLMGSGLLEIIFDGLLLWFIGCDLELNWGTSRYIRFLIVSVLGAAVLFLFLTFFFPSGRVYTLTGLTGFTNALLLAYAIIYPHRHFSFMLIFPVKAWICCALIIVMQLFSGFTGPAGVLSLAHLGAMVSGVAYLVIISSPKWKKFTEKRKQLKKTNKRSHLHLVKDDDDKPPKYWQ